MTQAIALDPQIRQLFRPERPLTVSQFADRYRLLVDRYASEPGRYRTARTPWVREIQDAFADPGVGSISFVKCARISGSEAMINMLHYACVVDPASSMLVLPTLPEARDEARGRLRESVLASPRWREQIRHGGWCSGERLDFARCTVYMGAMAAPSTLIRKTVRNLFVDEIDNATTLATKLGASLDLAMERVTTFGDRASMVQTSTPDRDDGPILSLYNATDRRRWYVPCPECGGMQVLEFERLKLDPEVRSLRDPGQIEATDCVHYECLHCGARIREDRKGWMNARGLWVPDWVAEIEPLDVNDAAQVRAAAAEDSAQRWIPHLQGVPYETRRRGYWMQGLNSPWRKWRAILAKYFETRHDRDRYKVFVNSWLGRGWHDVVHAVPGRLLREKATVGMAPGVVPAEAQSLLMTVDVQADHFWFVVRAWGAFERSWLIRYGRAETWDHLREIAYRGYYWLGDPAKPMRVAWIGIDTRHRRDEVHDFARTPGVVPLQGTASASFRFRPSRVEYYPQGGLDQHSITVYSVVTDVYKDKLHRHASSPIGEFIGAWHLHRDTSDEYIGHLTGERKVRVTRQGREAEKWQPVSSGRRVDLLDCEVYQMALADIARIPHMQPRPEEQARLAEMLKREEEADHG
jgi:phage terminase large subunit GpA-like protein